MSNEKISDHTMAVLLAQDVANKDQRIAELEQQVMSLEDGSILVSKTEWDNLQATIERVKAVGFNTHVSWNCDKYFYDGWNACREQIEAALQQGE